MISVCIATYNGEMFLSRQLNTILCQLGEQDEIIISDDGSTDNTLSIIKNYGDKRIKIIEGPHRHSPIWNFENALKHAIGDYIFLSDQDDEWMPNKVEVCLRYLESYHCIVSDNIVVDSHGEIIGNSFYKINQTRSGRFYNLLIKNGYLGCCMAFRNEVLKKALPFPPNIPMHDIWIGNVAAFNYDIYFVKDKLMRYCRHGDNASPTAEASIYPLWTRLCFRWIIVKNLIRRLA